MPGAQPAGLFTGRPAVGRRDYRMSELVADVGALIDASGARRVHLVGHDWGAAVARAAAAEMPERPATVSPISVPHPAFIKSITTSRQGLASWYTLSPTRRHQAPNNPKPSPVSAAVAGARTDVDQSMRHDLDRQYRRRAPPTALARGELTFDIDHADV